MKSPAAGFGGVRLFQMNHRQMERQDQIDRMFDEMVVDAHYEIPVAYEVTKASAGEQPVGRDLVRRLGERHPTIMDLCEQFLVDKGYDDTKLIETLWDHHEIKPVIDIRNCWENGEATRVVSGQRRVVYDYAGQVYCHCR